MEKEKLIIQSQILQRPKLESYLRIRIANMKDFESVNEALWQDKTFILDSILSELDKTDLVNLISKGDITFRHLLSCGFSWVKTIQGHQYWYNIASNRRYTKQIDLTSRVDEMSQKLRKMLHG